MLERMLPEWRALMKDVPYSVTAVASHAGLAADNVQDTMTKKDKRTWPETERAIKDAIEHLRDRCPECHRKGLKEAQRDYEQSHRTTKKRDPKRTTAR